jgi:galactokinase
MGGLVLPCAVDRFVEASGEPSQVWELDSDVAGGLRYVEALGAELKCGPHRVLVRSNVPPGSGLSSSAALLVALAAGLRPDLGGVAAALACQRAEQSATGVLVGVMDQFASALGRAGHCLLLDCATLEYRLVAFPDDLVIAVIDSGIRRRLADTPYNQRRREAEADDPRRTRHVRSEIDRVREFVGALESGDRRRLGELLVASHVSLRDDFEVSTPEVDAIVERAWQAPGCLGARIMGAGFGGSILALVEPGAEAGVAAAVERPTIFLRTADGAFAR